MKKILSLIGIILLFFFPIFAEAEIIPHSIYAVSHSDISEHSLKANEILEFQTLDSAEITATEFIEKDSILTIRINEHIKPKRGKRNGYLKINIISYTLPSKNNKLIHISNKEIKGTLRLSTPKDFKNIAKNTGVTITGKILKIPGFSQAVAISKGLLKPNPEQNRLQSAGTNLYKSTPLIYGEKGKDIEIEEDSIVVIKVKNYEEE